MSDIADLFARDPLELSEQDLDRIIARFREARHTFSSPAPAKGKAPAKPKDAEVAGLAAKLDLKF